MKDFLGLNHNITQHSLLSFGRDLWIWVCPVMMMQAQQTLTLIPVTGGTEIHIARGKKVP